MGSFAPDSVNGLQWNKMIIIGTGMECSISSTLWNGYNNDRVRLPKQFKQVQCPICTESVRTRPKLNIVQWVGVGVDHHCTVQPTLRIHW